MSSPLSTRFRSPPSPQGEGLISASFMASPRGEAPPGGGGEGRSPFLIEIFSPEIFKQRGSRISALNHFARISRAPHSPRFRSAPSPQGEGAMRLTIFADFCGS